MAGNLEGSINFVGQGELAGATSATQMPDRKCKGVMFKALGSNAGNVYIGGAGVTVAGGTTDTTSGWELDAGDSTPYLPCNNLNEWYRICDNAGDDLCYLFWDD